MLVSVLPSATPTFQSSAKSTAPTVFVPPSSINYFSYKGKFFSTLSNADLNGNPLSSCKSIYYPLLIDWILAPDDIDSREAISLNTWSTTTVIVASGVGYYSNSTWGLNWDYLDYLYQSFTVARSYSVPVKS